MSRRMILPSLKEGVRRSLEQQYRVISTKKVEDDVSYAQTRVREHDPAGYLPGQLLPTLTMKKSYYAVRSFWVETGLRFGSTAKVPLSAAPDDHLAWWQQGVDTVFGSDTNVEDSKDFDHPTLRLLQSILRHEKVPWEKSCFGTIVNGRRKDISVKQYDTLDDLVRHAEQSCGHLNRLVLQSGFVDEVNNPRAYEAARLVGICHGITNALRTSIPIISTTGKLIVPAELTQKYGVKSPRYLLSALGQGDETCVRALQLAVQDIADAAQSYLDQARSLRSGILSEPGHARTLPVLLPGLATEMFLHRLKDKNYELTNRELRNVGWMEQGLSAGRMYLASYRKTY